MRGETNVKALKLEIGINVGFAIARVALVTDNLGRRLCVCGGAQDTGRVKVDRHRVVVLLREVVKATGRNDELCNFVRVVVNDSAALI